MIYTSELIDVTNLSTGKTTYYLVVCNALRRIAKAEYDERYEKADGLTCRHTNTTKTHRRASKVMTYYTGEHAKIGLKENTDG